MRRIRVAMIAACPFPCPRGTPIRVRLLADALGRRGLDVHVVTYHLGDPAGSSERGAPYRVHRTPRLPTYRRTAPGPSYQKLLLIDPLLVVTLRRVLARHPVDIIHAHHYEGLIAALAARHRQRHPVIYDAHTLLASELPAYGLGLPGALKRALGARLDRWLPTLADHVIAVSDGIRSRLVHGGLPAERVSVVPSGAEAEVFAMQRVGRPRTDQGPVLVFAGNLAGYQGIELLLRAFRRILDARPDARLRVVSNGSFAALAPLAERLGILSQLERVSGDFERLPEFLAEADVALHPRTECAGLPQKLLNYMSAGLPIVSFRGAANMLRHLESAWLVEDGDEEAFAHAAVALLEDRALADRLGAAARKLVEGELSWGHAAERTLAVYDRVLGARTSEQRAASAFLQRV